MWIGCALSDSPDGWRFPRGKQLKPSPQLLHLLLSSKEPPVCYDYRSLATWPWRYRFLSISHEEYSEYSLQSERGGHTAGNGILPLRTWTMFLISQFLSLSFKAGKCLFSLNGDVGLAFKNTDIEVKLSLMNLQPCLWHRGWSVCCHHEYLTMKISKIPSEATVTAIKNKAFVPCSLIIKAGRQNHGVYLLQPRGKQLEICSCF